jgi:methylenetetrahydrofolate reductase (NADPH)
MSSGKLRALMEKNEFVVTCEINPLPNSSAESIRQLGETLKTSVDAAIVKDNPTAKVGMAAMAASAILIHEDIEPVLEMTARDRNRLALQSDALGAAAMGINNIICQTGEFHTLGDQPGSKSVYDLDSIQLLQMLKTMRDDKKLMNGTEIEPSPDLYLGAVWNPFGGPIELRIMRLAKKIEAGAQFVIVEGIQDLDRFADVMGQVRDKGLQDKIKIVAGVVFDESIDVQELIRSVREINGVAGIHIIAGDAVDRVPEIVDGAGLLPRPEL